MAFEDMSASKLESIARCGVCFEMSVDGRGIADLMQIAEGAHAGNSHVVMIGLAAWPVEEIRDVGFKAKGHVTAR